MIGSAARQLLEIHYVIPGHPPDDNNSDDASFVIYGYVPSIALAVIGTIWFGLLAVACAGLLACVGRPFFRVLRWDTLLGMCLLGTLLEAVGYILRCLSSRDDPYSISYFATQYCLIVIAPVFFATAIYLAVWRLIDVAGAETAPLAPCKILIIFLTCDIVTVVLQLVGASWLGAIQNGSYVDNSAPNGVLTAGLAAQTASFAIFFLIFFAFWYRLLRQRTAGQQADGHLSKETNNCARIMPLLGAAAALVEIRTIFRLVESAQGFFAYLSSHEAFFGCLEFLPIALALPALLVVRSLIATRLPAVGQQADFAKPQPAAV